MTAHWIAGIEAAGRLRYRLLFADSEGRQSAFEFHVDQATDLPAIRSAAFDRACQPRERMDSEIPQLVRHLMSLERFGTRVLYLRPEVGAAYQLSLEGDGGELHEARVSVRRSDAEMPTASVGEETLRWIRGVVPNGRSADVIELIEWLTLRFDWHRSHALDLDVKG